MGAVPERSARTPSISACNIIPERFRGLTKAGFLCPSGGHNGIDTKEPIEKQTMRILENRVKNLVFRFSVTYTQRKYHKESFHLDYEEGVYRQVELTKIMRDSIVHFALTPEEMKGLKESEDIGEMLRIAWNRISRARKEKKGDYGELLLFLILVVFFPTKKFVTKVRLRTSMKDQVKGFDCAHFTIENDEACLWLGEAKFHKSFYTAIRDAIQSIEEHCAFDFMKDEISILANNIELNQHFDEIEKLEKALSGKSLDRIRFRIPVLITYDSPCIKNNTSIGNIFRQELRKEIARFYEKIEAKQVDIKTNFELLFLLFPFECVSKAKQTLEEMEQASR